MTTRRGEDETIPASYALEHIRKEYLAMRDDATVVPLVEIRRAVADYMHDLGWCRPAEHFAHTEILGPLLHVPKFPDGSGYDFERFKSRSSR